MLSTDSCQIPPCADIILQSGFSCGNHLLKPEAAADQQAPQSAPLSGKQRRTFLKKERRKRKRQALAKLRECNTVDESENEQDLDDNEKEELGEQLHQEWLERERNAQEEFRLRREKEEAAQKRKEEEEKRIKDEWEEQQRKEKEAQEQKHQEKKDREEAVQKLLDQAESQLENGGSWKNPDAPIDYGTEKDKANCPFYLKTGACRFGDRCSRKHNHPISGTTLMIRSMFVTFGMEQSKRDDYDTDASLEYGEEEMQQQFLEFYDDVLPEFRNAGNVVQFKVSCNFEPHLRGNVYVQYETEDQCTEAFRMFNGRWYAGKQLQCEFSPVTKWKNAICGLFDRQRCPKGKHCNFLHVFRNPGNEFWEADRDLHLSSDRGGSLTGRHRMSSQRSYSPDIHRRRSERRSHSREKYSYRRRRSRSRDRRSRSRDRRSRSRSRQSRSRKRRSQSRERRSQSRDRRSRSRSRENRRSQHSVRRGSTYLNNRGRRSRSRERSQGRDKETDHQSKSCQSQIDSRTKPSKKSESNIAEEDSKNGSVERKSRKTENQSPSNGDAASAEAKSPSHHHKKSKRSKKKKKSKKKQKRKRSKSVSASSSAGSGKESEDDDDQLTLKKQDEQKTQTPTVEGETESLVLLQQLDVIQKTFDNIAVESQK